MFNEQSLFVCLLNTWGKSSQLSPVDSSRMITTDINLGSFINIMTLVYRIYYYIFYAMYIFYYVYINALYLQY